MNYKTGISESFYASEFSYEKGSFTWKSIASPEQFINAEKEIIQHIVNTEEEYKKLLRVGESPILLKPDNIESVWQENTYSVRVYFWLIDELTK